MGFKEVRVRYLVILALLAVLLAGCDKETTGPVGDNPLEGFVLIPTGTFVMGAPDDELGSDADEWPQHSVTLTKDFYIQTTEVTNQQYRDMAQWAFDNGYCTATESGLLDALDGSTQELLDLDGYACEISYSEGFFTIEPGKENHPVKEVSWFGSVAYCDWLSLQAGLPRAYDHSNWQCDENNPYMAVGYRLPTEAEWEYSCRAGSSTGFSSGQVTNTECDDPVLDEIGWYCGNAGESTHPVGQHLPNAWGVYDMHGNHWEQCNDWKDDNYYDTSPDTDPTGPGGGMSRVARGGSWHSVARACRSAARGSGPPDISQGDISFRPVRTAH